MTTLVVNQKTPDIHAALFQGEALIDTWRGAVPEHLLKLVQNCSVTQSLVASDENHLGHQLKDLLITGGIPCRLLQVEGFAQCATEKTRPLLTPHKIANIFGALYHFPLNDCVIVEMENGVDFGYVTKGGVYMGGATLSCCDPKLSERPPALGKNSLELSQSGAYFGLLGAVERLVAELRLACASPGYVMTVATGSTSSLTTLKTDLQDFIDCIDPHLTLIGLNQILKER